MRKILLMSDTHGHLDQKMINHVNWADEVWHAGDIGEYGIMEKISKLKPFRAVFGNIDNQLLRSQLKKKLVFYCEEVKVLITHIGGYPNKYNPKLKRLLFDEKPQLYICGHSHILKVISDKKLNLIHMNPGAAGIIGFHKIRTMIRFTINKKEIQNLEVVELGLRGKIISNDRQT